MIQLFSLFVPPYLFDSPALLILFTSLPILIFSILIHRAFLSPLSHIPGLFIARLTPLWIWYHSTTRHSAHLLTSLHSKYGPVVRISPSECVIADGTALQAIYGERGGFHKAACYANFDFSGHATIFSARDPGYRNARSKAVASLFSTGRIRARQGVIEACVRRFTERVRGEARAKGTVDVLNLSRSLALDAVGSFLFGRDYGGIEEEGDRLSASGFVDLLVEAGRFFYLPHWLFVAVQAVGERLCSGADSTAEAGGATLEAFARDVVRETPANDETYQGRLKMAGISDHENEVQCMDLMFAGCDSTGTNLSKLIWRLAKSPQVYKRLRQEVTKADAEDPSLSYNPQNLKYLDAVIHEGLRMGMSTPTRIPRVVPSGGWSYGGYYFPAGTTVGCQPHTLHFNSNVFPDPFDFRPERWLDAPSSEMQRDWIPFSLGQRSCLARNLAQAELQLAIRQVVREDLLADAIAVGGELEMHEWFNSKLAREKLEVSWQFD